MDPQVEAAFDAWLASIGMNRNSQVPYGQEANLSAQWESFLLNWGRTQGRTILAAPQQGGPGGVYQGPPGGSFNVPRVANPGFVGMAGQPGYQQPTGGGGYPVGIRVAPPTGAAPRGTGAARYSPPPSQNQAYKDPRSGGGVLYGEDRHW